MGQYDDIINLPHHRSEKHPRMAMLSRAAQFAPFAALTGYEESVEEAARYTDRKTEAEGCREEELDEALRELLANIRKKPAVRATFFVPDSRKEGGAYRTWAGRVKKIDEISRSIIFTDGLAVRFEDLFSLEPEEI